MLTVFSFLFFFPFESHELSVICGKMRTVAQGTVPQIALRNSSNVYESLLMAKKSLKKTRK